MNSHLPQAQWSSSGPQCSTACLPEALQQAHTTITCGTHIGPSVCLQVLNTIKDSAEEHTALKTAEGIICSNITRLQERPGVRRVCGAGLLLHFLVLIPLVHTCVVVQSGAA